MYAAIFKPYFAQAVENIEMVVAQLWVTNGNKYNQPIPFQSS
jgi:hypothetical protein